MVKIMQPAEAIALIKSGSSIMVGGFGNIGNPKKLIDMIAESDITSLTVIANDLGTPNVGLGRWVTNQKELLVLISPIILKLESYILKESLI